MPSNRSAGTEVPSKPPIPADYGPTVSAGSAILSLFAILTAWRGSRRTTKLERSTWFEKSFGENLRLSCRKLDKKNDSLKSLMYPSAKTLTALKDELAGIIAEIEDCVSDIRGILRELDQSSKVKSHDWESDFEKRYQPIDTLLAGAQEQTQELHFTRVVGKAHTRITTEVRHLRTKIELVKIKK